MIKAFLSLSNVNCKAGLSAGLCAVVLAGCGSAGDLAENVISGGAEPIKVSRETFASPVPCPPLQLKNGAYLVRKFQRGKDGERDALLYQGLVEDWAVSCSRKEDGQRQLKLGFAGDVTPGPAWTGGDIVLSLKVNIPASSDPKEKPLVSEVLEVPVSIETGGRGQKWTVVEDRFVIPMDQGSKIEFGFIDKSRR